jgi:hypothetical protein
MLLAWDFESQAEEFYKQSKQLIRYIRYLIRCHIRYIRYAAGYPVPHPLPNPLPHPLHPLCRRLSGATSAT